MLIHPRIDPVAIQLGPFAVHWYGLTYLVAFARLYFLALRRLRHPVYASGEAGAWTRKDIEDMVFLGVIGTIVGGRLGYVLSYKPEYYLVHPLEVFAVWQGGMSFHGGLLGVLASQVWFARSREKPFWRVMDLVAPCVPLGLAAGRIGNFINGELWGRVADPSLPWAMVFPQSGSMAPRHPSQFYQFLLEGVLLFILLWPYGARERVAARVSAAILVGYGVLRFIVEYFREPDSFLGLLALRLSMGQWLSPPMIVAGLLLWWWAGRAAAPFRRLISAAAVGRGSEEIRNSSTCQAPANSQNPPGKCALPCNTEPDERPTARTSLQEAMRDGRCCGKRTASARRGVGRRVLARPRTGPAQVRRADRGSARGTHPVQSLVRRCARRGIPGSRSRQGEPVMRG